MTLTLDDQHIYRLDGRVIPGATSVMSTGGLVDDTWFTEHGRDRGSAVHKTTEIYDKGEMDSYDFDPVVFPFLDAYKSFLSDTGFEVKEIELVIHSKSLMVGTTLDRVGFLYCQRSIIDLKTGQKTKATGPQTALHKLAWNEHHPKEPVQDRYGLYLKDTGKYELVQYDDPNDIHFFNAALWVARWKGDHK